MRTLLRTSRPLRRIIALGAAVVLALAGGTVAILDRLRSETIAEAALGLATLNASLAEQTTRAIEGIDVAIAGVVEQIQGESVRNAADFKRLKGDRATFEILQAKASGMPQIEALSLIASDGSLVNFTRKFPAPTLDLSMRDYFRALKNTDASHASGGAIATGGRAYVSRPVRSIATQEWTLYIARRVNGPDGAFVGLVVGAIRLSYFERFYESLYVTPGSGFSLWWHDGMLLARYPTLPDKVGTIAAPAQVVAMLDGKSANTLETTSTIDGAERILSFQATRGYPLAVGVSRMRTEVLARWRDQAVTIGIAGLVAAVAVALMLWAMTRQFAAYEAVNRALRERQKAVDARDEAEENVRQLQKMEALGQLTGGVAHDFNNLLQAVRSSLHLLGSGGSGEAARRALDVARQAVERGAVLTQQLLAFARRQQLAPQTVDLGAQVAGMVELLERTLGDTIRIRIERAPGLWAALVDPHQFDTALLNLAINARDAMPDGGTLTIAVGNRPVGNGDPGRGKREDGERGLAAGDYVAVTVRDTGTGMPEAVATRAFEPFFTTKGVGAGSGLGLSMVHGLTAQSGGGVWLDSRPGAGTTVTMYLPAVPAAHPAAPVPPLPAEAPVVPHPAAAPAIRVLLVEDDALVRMANAAVLTEAGMTVAEAMEGGEALALLDREDDLDILVTDFAMPGMTGADLARAARRRRPGLPVLIVTGYAEKAVLQELQAEAGIRILAKPIPPPALIGHIAAALQRQPVP